MQPLLRYSRFTAFQILGKNVDGENANIAIVDEANKAIFMKFGVYQV